MKKIKNFLRKLVLKLFPKQISSSEKSFIKETYKLYMKLENFIKYRDTNMFTGISIETSTYCNRKCIYCPNHNNPTPKLFADENIIYKALEDLAKMKYSGWIGWNFYNEPTLDDRLISFINIANTKVKMATNILFTNGDYLTLEKAIEYKNIGINQFVVTIHDKNPEKLYNKLLPIKKAIGNSFILKTLTKDELNTRAGSIEVDKNDIKFTYCNLIINPVIDKDGNFLICCNDYFRESKIGNILEKSILEIWNDKGYRNLRKKLQYQLKESVENRTIPEMCIRCYYSMNNIKIDD